jgi:hypothetical protein
METLKHIGVIALAAFACILSISLPVAMASTGGAVTIDTEVAFIIAGFCGMALHYVKKKSRHELRSGMFEYFFIDHPGGTISAAFAYVAAATAVLMTGQVESMSTITAVMCGLTTGWTCNSALNKGE